MKLVKRPMVLSVAADMVNPSFCCMKPTWFSSFICWRPNGKRVSRAQGTPTNQDDDHAKRLSLTSARVGVGWTRLLGAVGCI